MMQNRLPKSDRRTKAIKPLATMAMALLVAILVTSIQVGRVVYARELRTDPLLPKITHISLNRAQAAEAARLTGLANDYLSVDDDPRQVFLPWEQTLNIAGAAETARAPGLASSPIRVRRAVVSPAFDYEDEWYDLEYRWLKSSPIRVQSPVVSPAFDYEDEWYDLEYWWLK